MNTDSPNCSICGRCTVALPCNLMSGNGDGRAHMPNYTRHIARGEAVFHTGDEFRSVHTVQRGWFKTTQSLDEGREQITGFQMAGDVLDLGGIASGVHGCSAIALDDSVICSIPNAEIRGAPGRRDERERCLRRIMSALIVREQRTMLMLGNMSAEERVVWFLNDLSARLAARGECDSEFDMRMSRGEIGSLLGLELETVSRLFSKLRRDGVIGGKRRHVVMAGAGPARHAPAHANDSPLPEIAPRPEAFVPAPGALSDAQQPVEQYQHAGVLGLVV